jgi:polar amino acid transport system substrate-binding protein
MGTNAAFPPYEYYDEDGKTIIGIDAEIAQAVADKLGMKLTIKDMEFDSLLTAVQSNAVDIVFAGLTVSEERKQSVDFTMTYATGVQVVIVPNDSEIASVDDLAGKVIGVQAGTTGDIYCTDEFGQENVKQFTNGALAVAALQNGQVDCVVIDNEPAKAFVKANEGLKILDTEYAVEDYAAAISKENTELTAKVNEAMEALKADGTIDAILAKYIKAE